MKLPVLISVPHAGLEVPPEMKNICQLSEKEIIEDGDEGAADIYYPLEKEVKAFVKTDIARAIVDMNRTPEDFSKDGVIKTHTCHNIPIYQKPLAIETANDLIENYYQPYHRALSSKTRDVRVGLDCHTMAELGPSVAPDTGKKRPAACVSNADKTCDISLIQSFAEILQDMLHHEVAINNPFNGGYIIKKHSLEIPWLQIELSRAHFLTNVEKSVAFHKTIVKWIVINGI
ncbi:conserved hypothetical protein [Candidatus Desulfarcum epimagneticum]|uniref:N-formylglutamate amidohydrolase n=1 Tax=uncultured Desulfobacteraceae bacterium TaxID=218296 RepID=A0A484HEV3_9BACT|nr:conserved hypothetical protein [uncultured Desulfobacteraceae bacterium]